MYSRLEPDQIVLLRGRDGSNAFQFHEDSYPNRWHGLCVTWTGLSDCRSGIRIAGASRSYTSAGAGSTAVFHPKSFHRSGDMYAHTLKMLVHWKVVHSGDQLERGGGKRNEEHPRLPPNKRPSSRRGA